MARGGARIRSGPAPDPASGRSERRGYKLTELPAEGFDGPVPAFPLMKRAVYYTEWVDKKPERHIDLDATEAVAEREAELWEWVWRTPQACAWSMPSEAWRLMTIAMWVRTMVICESSEATAADKNSLHRFADQIGLTTAGLAEMGWAVKRDEVGERRVEREAEPPVRRSSRDRMKVVNGDGG